MEKLEKLMSRDIDGQKLGQQKKKLKSKHKFFFQLVFLKSRAQKNCNALWSDFPKKE